jgi:hypothetical protein
VSHVIYVVCCLLRSVLTARHSYFALPNTHPVFTGVWTSTNVQGIWSGATSAPSSTSPPLTEVLHFAMSGSGLQSVSGLVIVTTTTNRNYNTSFCCGFGCASTTTATVSTRSTTSTPTAQPNPGLPVTFVTVNQVSATCPQLMLCSVYLNNTRVPVVSAFGDFVLTNPASSLIPVSVNLVADSCSTYVALPNVSPLTFTGTWTASALQGSWGGDFSEPSATPPPLVEVVHFAVSGGAAGSPRGVRGSIQVTTQSQLQYSADICCGDCSPPICPETVTVPYARYTCTKDQSSATLNNLTTHSCLSPNLMFMNPPNASQDVVPPVAPPQLLPVVRVTISTAGFSPRDITARVGDTVLFVWLNGTHSVTSGSCAAPSPQLFNSGLFAAPHSFVLLVGPAPLVRNGFFPLYSKENCLHTAGITTI